MSAVTEHLASMGGDTAADFDTAGGGPTVAPEPRVLTAVPGPLGPEMLRRVDTWWRAANYLAVGQIYLMGNPLLGEPSLKEARGALVSISGGNDLTLYEIDEAMTLVREAVSEETDVVMGASFDPTLDGAFKISVVATGLRN